MPLKSPIVLGEIMGNPEISRCHVKIHQVQFVKYYEIPLQSITWWHQSPGILSNLQYRLVVWNISYFPIYLELSAQLTFIFFRGVGIPPTRIRHNEVTMKSLRRPASTLGAWRQPIFSGSGDGRDGSDGDVFIEMSGFRGKNKGEFTVSGKLT